MIIWNFWTEIIFSPKITALEITGHHRRQEYATPKYASNEKVILRNRRHRRSSEDMAYISFLKGKFTL